MEFAQSWQQSDPPEFFCGSPDVPGLCFWLDTCVDPRGHPLGACLGPFAHTTHGDRASRHLGACGQFSPLPLAGWLGLGFDGRPLAGFVATRLDPLAMVIDQPDMAVWHQPAVLDHLAKPPIPGLGCCVAFFALAIARGPWWISATQLVGQLFGDFHPFCSLAAIEPCKHHQRLASHGHSQPHSVARIYRVQVWVSGWHVGTGHFYAAAGPVDTQVQPSKQTNGLVVLHQLAHGSAAGSVAGGCHPPSAGFEPRQFNPLSAELYSSQHPFVVAVTLVGPWARDFFRTNRSSFCRAD